MRSVGADETLQQGILRAINLVDRFMGAHKEGDVDVLKQQVHAAIAAGARVHVQSKGSGGGRAGTEAGASTATFTTFGTTNRDGVGGRVGAEVRSSDLGALSATAPAAAAAASKEKTAAEVDWSLPPVWIDRKARLQHNKYVDMLRARDERDLAEDARKKALVKTKAVEQRQFLDSQVAFQARLRRENAEEIAKDREAIDADLVVLERENQAKAAKRAAIVAKEKAQRSQQVEENRARVARAAARDLAEDKARVRAQMEEARVAEAKKRAQQAANKRALQKVQEDNVVRLRIKAEEMERARLRDQEMLAENDRVAEERERKRLADIAAHEAKIRAKFEAGGGVALEAGMAVKAAEDERRMHEELAKQDAREREKARVRRETAARLEAERHASVEQQLSRRRQLAEQERARKEEMSRAMVRDVEDLKAKERLMKAKEEAKKRVVRDDIIAQMKADATRRFVGGRDDMPERELRFNGLSLHA